MTFIFRCSKCGSTLYEDPKPLLHGGLFKSKTYLENVLMKVGGKCPACGNGLKTPPLEIEVVARGNGNGGLKVFCERQNGSTLCPTKKINRVPWFEWETLKRRISVESAEIAKQTKQLVRVETRRTRPLFVQLRSLNPKHVKRYLSQREIQSSGLR